MANLITLYHGSEQIVGSPVFGKGKSHNDFGKGFYCTENVELAKEWAVNSFSDGFLNEYVIDTEFLKIINLNSPDFTILNWIAVLLEHRIFPIKNPVAARAKRYLLDNFYVNVNAYDIITGYRADDSYFDYAEAFINNTISVEQLAEAMKIGKLGEQIVIKSKYAFDLLEPRGFDKVDKDKYYVLRKARNEESDAAYMKILEESLGLDDGLYVRDIIRWEIKNDDPRIPRNFSR